MNKVKQSDRQRSRQQGQLPNQQGDLEDYIEQLAEHQQKCVKERNYIEAEFAKQKIKELIQQLKSQSKNEIKQQHFQQFQDVDKAYQDELSEFEQFWQKKIQQFQEEALQAEENLNQRHQDEQQQFLEDLEKSIPQHPKDCPQLLNWKKMEDQFAKQEEFIEAHKIQQKINKLAEEQFMKWQRSRREKINACLKQLIQRQQNELNALKQRIASGKKEQQKIKELESHKLQQKYQNVKNELLSTQQFELTKIEKQTNKSIFNSQMQHSRVSTKQLRN